MLGAVFASIGLALAIAIPLNHPDAQKSSAQTMLAIMTGSLFFIAGLLIGTKDTRIGARLQPLGGKLVLIVFASLFLFAPWVEGSGASPAQRVAFGVLAGIMALLMLKAAFTRRKSNDQERTKPDE